MTDPDLDLLASAYLDGATSPEETGRVERDPAARARVEELRAVRELVGEVPSTDRARRDAAIAAALEAFDDGAAPAAPTAPVIELAPRRGGLRPRTVRVLGAAAVVALLALLVPALASLDGHDDDTATFESTSDAISGDQDAGQGAEDSGQALGTTTTMAAAAPDSGTVLGTFDDLDALAAAVTAGALDARDANPTSLSERTTGFCAAASTGGSTVHAMAIVAGEPVEVQLHTEPDGTRRLTVLSADGCALLDRREL